MIRVEVDSRSGYMNIKVEGHANYAPHGQDIVCAGVSAILQTAVLGLQAIADAYPNHVQVVHIDRSDTVGPKTNQDLQSGTVGLKTNQESEGEDSEDVEA